MKKILFVCERNVVMGPAAVAIFSHMGVSLLSRYDVTSGGWGTSVDINSNDMAKIQQILQVKLHTSQGKLTNNITFRNKPFLSSL